jgi:hypothetical protein
VACIVWLFVAVILLHALASKIEIAFSQDIRGAQRSRLDLLLLPYRTPPRLTVAAASPPAAHSVQDKLDGPSVTEMTSFHPQPDTRRFPHFMIAITMRHEYSWAGFETIIETLAVGIYLYARFVLASLLFLSGGQAII